MRDVAGLLVNNSATFKTTDIGRKSTPRHEQQVSDLRKTLGKSMSAKIANPDFWRKTSIGNYFLGEINKCTLDLK